MTCTPIRATRTLSKISTRKRQQAVQRRPMRRSRQGAARGMASEDVSQIYQIVRATMRDVHAIRRLEQVIFPLDAYTYLSLSTLLMWPGGANFKAIDPTGALAGFVAGSPNWGTHIDWIVTLGVHPDHQRRGLGRRLLNVCEQNMSQNTIRLTVRASN